MKIIAASFYGPLGFFFEFFRRVFVVPSFSPRRCFFFYFLSDVASSPLVYFKEMRFSSFFFDFEAHTQQQQK